MKKIFFLIAVLFSFTGYAQTVGQLRYDTVKMYKVGGTTELILQNASSGVVGGVLRNVINGRTVFQTVVDTVFKNATADSFVYYIGGVRRAFKDSSGSGTYARDTIVAGRGLTGTAINVNKVQLDNDSAVYIVTQINDTTVSYTHYDGRIDTVTIVSSGGGGGGSGWSLTGNAGTTPGTNFIGTTDAQGLMFKANGLQSGYIDIVNDNTSLGEASLLGVTSGSFNTAVGHFSLRNNTSGNNNIGIGYSPLLDNTTGHSNVGVGYQSFFNNTTGYLNVGIGQLAGSTNETGIANTIIGGQSDVATSSTDSSGAFGFKAVSSTRKMAFSPYFNTMFLNLDSASGTAPAIAGIDENGNWAKYATPSGGSSQWTDTTAGIYYADKVGIGGVMNPDSALTVTGSAKISNTLLVGIGHSNAGNRNLITGNGSTVGTGNNNIISGSDHAVANNLGANVIFGESHSFGNAEASTIINGFGNIVGDGANDALVGGTGSSTFASSTIAIGLGNETNAVESISIGGGGNAANGIYSGTFAGTAHEAEDSAAVAIGGQNNSVGGVNAAILGGENNFTSGRNTVVLGGSGINGTMANTTYVDSLRVGGKIVAPNLPTSGTYSKSLGVTSNGTLYLKDTLAVSGVYATLTGSETLTNKTITAPILSGTLTGTGIIGGSTVINTTGSITAFNISATGLLRSAAASRIEHNGRNQFNAVSDGFETLTANSGAANTANLSVGSLRTGYVAKTANYTATAFDETISCSTNAFTITLPTAVGCAGQKYNITNSTAANTITIGTTSSQTFANVTATPTTLSLAGLGAVIVVSDGANWLQLK